MKAKIYFDLNYYTFNSSASINISDYYYNFSYPTNTFSIHYYTNNFYFITTLALIYILLKIILFFQKNMFN